MSVERSPDEVIDLVMKLPKTDNPVIYDGILDIALQLPGEQSAKLKDKILEYANMEHQIRTHKYAKLLAHWAAENQTSAALELSRDSCYIHYQSTTNRSGNVS